MEKLSAIAAESATIEQFLDRLAREGYAIVPREPTSSMICAALDTEDKNPRAFSYTEHWRAMVRAGVKVGIVTPP
jgi:hypothetical protein